MKTDAPHIPVPKTKKQYVKLVEAGSHFFKNEDFANALKYFSKALNYEDYQPNLLVLMSRCLFNLGMKSKAISMMEHALHQNADNPGICDILGKSCMEMGFFDLAIKFYTIYCQTCPDDPIGYCNLATAMRESGQLDESIEILQDIIPIFPESAHLWNAIGASVSFRDGYPVSQPFYEEAHRLDPTIASVVSNLSLVYTNLQQYEKAWEFAHKAVKLSPKNFMCQRALAHSSYNIGKFDDAFEALAWHNHLSNPDSVFMPYKIEHWQGQDLSGKTILVGAEQGVGDEVLLAALYPDLIREAEHVIIGCDRRLVPLFQNSFKEATIVPYKSGQHELGYKVRLYDGIDPEKIDYMCLYTEVLRHRWRSREDIPDMSAGFLSPAEDKVAYWKEKITQLPHNISVGICWTSQLQEARRAMFYAQLEDWVPVLATKNVNFINVQYGDVSEEIQNLLDKHGIVLHNFEELDLKDDFEGTAAMMKNLDLVMGAASAPVSQAATVGTQVWWVIHNNRFWESFGKEDGTYLFETALMTPKTPALTWAEFMPLFAKEEFTPWVEKKLKEKSA
ncbi:tetratricopeptide repeat protein [Paremcibacter congregatus]|uniref:tetratricopeptide repeat protein n=1 Tax=Paremcibacter congregatus TaxID=2043170 RepID=UPI0030EDDE3B|tara:strand:- start:28082 stop:29767 length:1686 start_codon:yes stop_codon:yes gene_type:complete